MATVKLRLFKQQLEKIPHDGVLIDLGAGPMQFYDIFGSFAQVVPVDFYPYEHVQVVADLNQKLPFKNETVNVVVMSNVLEHISNAEQLLQECFRILKPGGILVATVPFLMRIHQKPFDFNRYTHYKLKELLAGAGFGSTEVVPLGLPVHVYEAMQFHFFCYALSCEYSNNRLLNTMAKLWLKFVWNMQKMCMRLCSVLYRKMSSNEDYTQGYGLVGRKTV